MRLREFILENVQPILSEWEAFAGSLAPGAKMTKLALRDDAESILLAAARDMQVGQSGVQQTSKSQGHGGAGGAESERLDDASALHGVGRAGSGFDILEVVSEYRALRASVLRLWRESLPQPDIDDIDDITRFNESMDQSLATAVGSYSRRVDQSRRMFLAVLSHDLRNPLTCIRMAALVISRSAEGNAKASRLLSQIETNADAIRRLIDDLIDFASTGLGSAMPLTRGPVDLERLGREVVDASRTAHPGRTLRFHADGDLAGHWDAGRLRQVVSNLVGNALQHGSETGAVGLSLASEGATAVLAVHNEGAPIPSELLATIFDPLVRYAPDAAVRRVPGSVGLGLYIVREIVVAHGGTVDVVSTAQEGTTFTARLPRAQPAEDDKHGDTKAAASGGAASNCALPTPGRSGAGKRSAER
ncbi:sensor histidine kinase [Thiobacillus denitrificans]|nr:HAMP domain-containing sensor histidine kinase [Thiobacillus denitrificans]